MTKTTKAQAKTLQTIARLENSKVPVAPYGPNIKSFYALLDAGLVTRDNTGRWAPTEAGRKVLAG